jgi:hypothetical protein
MFGSWAQRQGFTAQPFTLCGSYDGTRLFINSLEAGGTFDFFESSDNGYTWVTSVLTGAYIKSCGSNADRRIYYSTATNTLEYTLDNGVTFSTLMVNAQSNSNPTNKDIAVSYSLSTIYYLQSSSVYATHDMGVTWNPCSNLGFFSTSLSIGCSSNGQYVGFIGDPEGADSGFGNTLYTSCDFGSNWVSLSSSNPGKPLYLETRQALQSVSISGDGSSIFAGAFQGQLNTSRNYGSTFTTYSFTNSLPNLTYFSASAINSNGESILAGSVNADGGQAYVVQSVNGGSTWSIAIENNDNWPNVFVSQDGQTRIAAATYFIYTFGFLTSNFSTFDPATSLIELQPSWSYKMTMPDATPYQGKQITFVKPEQYQTHQIQFLSQQSTVIHTLSNTFAQFVGVSSNWLPLGNDSGFFSNTFTSQKVTSHLYTTIPPYSLEYPTRGYTGNLKNPQVITNIAYFSSIDGYYSSIQVALPVQVTTSNFVVSTLVFQTSITTPLLISSGALLYNGVNYSETVSGEILQSFTA